jgi:hypothetical protein
MPLAVPARLALALVLATACDSKPAESKPADAEAVAAEPAAAEPADTKSSGAKAADAKADGKAADTAPADAKAEPKADAKSDALGRFGSCKVSVTGAVTKTVEAPGGMSALGSDHFMSDEEMRKALAVLSGADGIDEAMKKDPRIYTLIVNCVADGVSVNFLPGNGSQYADVPFGPKRYDIKSGFGAAKGKMSVMMSIDGQLYSAAPGGFLDVTKLDKTGLAGTFSFAANGTAGKIEVSGTIDYRCAHQYAMCREGRGE